MDVAGGMSCVAGMGVEVCVDGAGRVDDGDWVCSKAVIGARAGVGGGNSKGTVGSVGGDGGNRVSSKLG